jgi:hypothetical protein
VREREEATDAERPLAIRWSFKGTGVLSDGSRAGLWRTRVEPSLRLGPRVRCDFAYEQRVRFTSVTADSAGAGPAGAVPGVLPPEGPPPYRLAALDWEIADGTHAAWRHEIDRAALRAEVSRIGITAGRQAIGWGRGVLFGAIDLFGPFSPFEADREWRRGADALRFDARLSSRASADVVLAFDGRASRSAYAGRLRGYAGDLDVEVVAGRRASDMFGGAASSFVIGPAELHFEMAAFRTPAAVASQVYPVARTVVKVVAGGSSRLPLGSGVLFHLEYHYSGFGANRARAIQPSMQDREFVGRVLRGDTQILTRHALALVASYEWSPLIAWSVALVHEPIDGSGVIAPSLTLTFNDRWSLAASAYLSYGLDAAGLVQRSAYGAAPHTAVVQLRFYR